MHIFTHTNQPIWQTIPPNPLPSMEESESYLNQNNIEEVKVFLGPGKYRFPGFFDILSLQVILFINMFAKNIDI